MSWIQLEKQSYNIMPIYISTSCLANGSNVFDVLEQYDRAGLRNVELGASHKYIDSLSPAKFKQYDFVFIAHHYFPPPEEPFIVNLASQDLVMLKRSKDQIKKSIEFCYSLGIELFTLHAGFRVDPDINMRFPKGQPVTPYEEAFTTLIESIDEINSYAQQRGVKIAIENNVLAEYNVVDGQNKFLLLCEAEEFERLWKEISSANVGILLDLGHLKATSYWLGFDKYEFIDRVKDRVFAIHIHENNEQVDEHRALDETSWCFEIIGRECFANFPIALESTKLNIDQIVQQASLIEDIIEKG